MVAALELLAIHLPQGNWRVPPCQEPPGHGEKGLGSEWRSQFAQLP